MFISTKYLVAKYGIDDAIARFFVDREPPANNLYWHEKLLYLRPAPGYLFIPLIIDLLYKIGLDKHGLMSEEFIRTMEQVGHISALEETQKIPMKTAIEKCGEIVKEEAANQAWLSSVMGYFKREEGNFFTKLSTPFKALHRGDMFLFSLARLEFPTALFEKIAEQWFALISTLLLIDDALDIESDKETGDENAYVESGLNAEGLEQIAVLVKQNLEAISKVNETMAAELARQHQGLMQKPDILALLKPSA